MPASAEAHEQQRGRVVVVVGHSIIAEGLHKLIGDDTDFEMARVVGCDDRVVDRIIAMTPDIIVIDDGCPGWRQHRLRFLNGVFEGRWNLMVVMVGWDCPEVEFYEKRRCAIHDVSGLVKALKQSHWVESVESIEETEQLRQAGKHP